MNEMNVVRNPVDPNPMYRVASLGYCAKFFDFNVAVTNCFMASQAQSYCWDSGRCSLGDVPVAESAIKTELPWLSPGMNRMRVRDRLVRPVVISEYHWLTEPSGHNEHQDENSDNKPAEACDAHDRHHKHLLGGRFFVLEVPWYQIPIILNIELTMFLGCQFKSSSPARNLSELRRNASRVGRKTPPERRR
ncbi:MAG: hypothetical protein VB961_11295 [Dehalococcoidia bacterium]